MAEILTPIKATLRAVLAENLQRQMTFVGFTALVFVLCHIGLPFQTFPDTQRYLYLHDHINQPDVWEKFMYVAPALIQLIYLGVNSALAVTILQATVSFLAWWFLAIQMRDTYTRPEVRSLVFYLTLWGAMGSNVLFWNRIMLTESLSLSALCFFVGGWLLALRQQRYWSMVLAGVALIFLRDAMIYLVLPLSGCLALFQQSRKLLTSLMILALATSAAEYFSDAGKRYVGPLVNSIENRILPNVNNKAFFVERGLPVSPELMACSGKYDCAIPADAMQWIDTKGKKVYEAWLIHTLPQRVRAMLTERECIIPGHNLNNSYMQGQRSGLYVLAALPPVPTPRYWLDSLGVAAFLVFLRLIQYHRSRNNLVTRQEIMWALVGGMALSNLFVSYWGDTMEAPRHCLSAMLLLHISLLGMTAALTESFIYKNTENFRG